MRFHGFLSALVILSALAVPAATSPAQGPAAPTAFDGKYVRTVTLSGGRGSDWCNTITSVRMTITGGQVVIHEMLFKGDSLTFRGSINAAGEVSAFLNVGQRAVHTVSGTIHDNVFTGQHIHGSICYWKVEMAPAPAPTTPFDGWYRGVSRELLDSGSGEPRCYPRALTPPQPLTITDGVVQTPGKGWWEGTVTPQGTALLRNPKFTRVDAQIDRQGTITGLYRGEFPPDLLAQIGGGVTNCIIKFVWQKE